MSLIAVGLKSLFPGFTETGLPQRSHGRTQVPVQRAAHYPAVRVRACPGSHPPGRRRDQLHGCRRACPVRSAVSAYEGGSATAFGVEDDLLSMPHSVLVKIQYGGLLGLQRLLRTASQVGERVDDIQALVAEASLRFRDAVPCTTLVDDITAFKPRARRGR